MPRRLNGLTVLAILAAFFATVFAANGTLVYFALHTLRGEEMENPYDASQAFNKRIAEARAQDERAWKVDITARAEGAGERIMTEFRDRDGTPIEGLKVTARFQHPFDKTKDAETTLASDGGEYAGVAAPVPPGRWTLVIEAFSGAERLFRSENKVAVADTATTN